MPKQLSNVRGPSAEGWRDLPQVDSWEKAGDDFGLIFLITFFIKNRSALGWEFTNTNEINTEWVKKVIARPACPDLSGARGH